MNLRHLRYFVALAQEKNHARAADACNVTQPTLSEAVRQLEHELAIPLIDRNGARFRGLTAAGERTLLWAQRILADGDALQLDLAEMRDGLTGNLRLGVIPAAMPIAPLLANPFSQEFPRVTLTLLSLTSIEIQRGLDAGTLEAGVTYLDNEPLQNIRTLPLYRERYIFLTPAGGPFDGADRIGWRSAARLPLCLLTPDMQNRRIVNRLFAEGGAGSLKVAIETNSVLALVAQVRTGQWSSVIPHTFLPLLGGDRDLPGLKAVPLVEPDASHIVGLVAHEREPASPLTRALLKAARDVEMARLFT